MGEAFPHDRWASDRPVVAGETITGRAAIARLERSWQGTAQTWRNSYAYFLAPLLSVVDLTPDHLRSLIARHDHGTRSRQRAATAATALAAALGLGADLLAELRAMGRGYSPRSAVPRDLPSDQQIEAVVDALPSGWQWVAGICATYGARPHEAILHATVQPSGLLSVSNGKTGSRQSLPLPRAWIERWDLQRKRLPAIRLDRSGAATGVLLGVRLKAAGAPFRGYDLRHAWAVRAILHPSISPSLAAKSMGHSLSMHARVYQRWFDQEAMVSVLEGL